MKIQPRVIEKHSAGLGQRNAARLTLKQLYTNLQFEIANLPNQRGLRCWQSPLSGVAGLRHERLGSGRPARACRLRAGPRSVGRVPKGNYFGTFML
jgi:hypothetical protein